MKGQPRNTGKTVSEAEFRRMWMDPSLSAAEIGRRLGITHQAVSHRARQRGLPPRKGPNVTARRRLIDGPEFAAMWQASVSLTDLARLYGCSHGTVCNAARRMGLPPRYTNRWHMITLADYRALQLRAAMAASASETAAALRMAEMVDNFQVARWAGRTAA